MPIAVPQQPRSSSIRRGFLPGRPLAKRVEKLPQGTSTNNTLDSNPWCSKKYKANDVELLKKALSSICVRDFTGTLIASFTTGTYSSTYEPILRQLGVDLIRIENPSAAEVHLLKELPGYFCKPIKIVWQLAVDKFDNYLQNLSGKQRREIQRSLRRSETLITNVEQLTPKSFDQWYKIYDQEVAGRSRGRRVIDSDWLANKDNPEAYRLISVRDPITRKLIGGAIVKSDAKLLKLTIAYAAYTNESRSFVPGTRVFKTAMEIAHLEGFRVLSHGQDSNLYGHYLSVGLMEYKSSLGFYPLAKDQEIIKIINPKFVNNECFFFAYDGDRSESKLKPILLGESARQIQLPSGYEIANLAIQSERYQPPDISTVTQLLILPYAKDTKERQLGLLASFEQGIELITRQKRNGGNFRYNDKLLHPTLKHFSSIITESLDGKYSRDLFNESHIKWFNKKSSLEPESAIAFSLEQSLSISSYIGARVAYDSIFPVVLEFLTYLNAPLCILENASSLDSVDLLNSCMHGLESHSIDDRNEFSEFLSELFEIDLTNLHASNVESSEKGPISLASINLETHVDNQSIDQARDLVDELYARFIRYTFARNPIQCLQEKTISKMFFSDTIGGRAVNLIYAALLNEPYPEEIRELNTIEAKRIKEVWSKLQTLITNNQVSSRGVVEMIARILPKTSEHKIDHIKFALQAVGYEGNLRFWGKTLVDILDQALQILPQQSNRLFISYLMHRISFDTPAEKRDLQLIGPYLGMGHTPPVVKQMTQHVDELNKFFVLAEPSARYFEIASLQFQTPLSTAFNQRSELQAEYLCRKYYLSKNRHFELFGEDHRLVLSALAKDGDYLPLLQNIYIAGQNPCEVISCNLSIELLKQIREKPSKRLHESEFLFIILACIEPRLSDIGFESLNSIACRKLGSTIFDKQINTRQLEEILGGKIIDQATQIKLSIALQDLLKVRLLSYQTAESKNFDRFEVGEEFILFFNAFHGLKCEMNLFYESFTNLITSSDEASKYSADSVFVAIGILTADNRIDKDLKDCPHSLQKLHRALMSKSKLNFLTQRGDSVYAAYFKNFAWSEDGVLEPTHGTLRHVSMRQLFKFDHKSVMSEYLRWALPKLNLDRLDELFLEHAKNLAHAPLEERQELLSLIVPVIQNRSFINAEAFDEFFQMIERFDANYAAVLRQATISCPEFLFNHPWTDYGYSSQVTEKVRSFVGSQHFGPQQCEQVVRFLFSHGDIPAGLFWVEKMLVAAPLNQANELIYFIRAWLGLEQKTQIKFISERMNQLFSREIQRLSREVSRAKEFLDHEAAKFISNNQEIPKGIDLKKQKIDRQHRLFEALANARNDHEEYYARKDLYDLFKTELPLALPAISERQALQFFINSSFVARLRLDSSNAASIRSFMSNNADFLEGSGILSLLSMYSTFADKQGIAVLKILLEEMSSSESRIETLTHPSFQNQSRLSLNLAGRFRYLFNDLLERGLSESKAINFMKSWSPLWRFAEVPGISNHTVSLTHDIERWCKHGEEPIISCQRLSSKSGEMGLENWNRQFGACPNANGRPLARMLLPQLKLFEYRIGTNVAARALVEVTVSKAGEFSSDPELHLLVEAIHSSVMFDKYEEFKSAILKIASELDVEPKNVHFSSSEKYPAPLAEKYRIYRDTFRTAETSV